MLISYPYTQRSHLSTLSTLFTSPALFELPFLLNGYSNQPKSRDGNSSYQIKRSQKDDGVDTYTLEIRVPELLGRDMEALDLSVEGDRLHLSIPALELQVSEGMRSVWRELPTQKRELRFQIPARVNHDAIKAHLKGDTLNIELPLTATQAHKIEIQGSRSL